MSTKKQNTDIYDHYRDDNHKVSNHVCGLFHAIAEHFQCSYQLVLKYIYSVNQDGDILLVIPDEDLEDTYRGMPSMSLLHDIARGLLFNPYRMLEWGVIDPDIIYVDKSAEGYELLIKRALGPYTGGKYA